MHPKWSKHKLGWKTMRSKLYLADKYKICKIKTEILSLNIQWDQNWQVFKQNKTTQKCLSQLSFRKKWFVQLRFAADLSYLVEVDMSISHWSSRQIYPAKPETQITHWYTSSHGEDLAMWT